MDGSREGSRGLCQYWAPEPDAQFGFLGVFRSDFWLSYARREAEGGVLYGSRFGHFQSYESVLGKKILMIEHFLTKTPERER